MTLKPRPWARKDTQVIAAALDIAEEHGLGFLTIQRAADASGVAIRTVFNNFTAEGLRAAVIAQADPNTHPRVYIEGMLATLEGDALQAFIDAIIEALSL